MDSSDSPSNIYAAAIDKGGLSSSWTQMAATQGINVSLSPQTATLASGGTQQFTPTVTGATNSAVTWSINPQAGTISSSGLYTAPATISAAQAVTITATSVQNSTVNGTATVNLVPWSLAINPQSVNVVYQGATGSVTVSSNLPNWSASSAASWIHITSVNPQSGNGQVTYSIDSNLPNCGSQRSGTIAIGYGTTQATLTVTQDAAPALAISPTEVFNVKITWQPIPFSISGCGSTANATWSVIPANPPYGNISVNGIYQPPATIGGDLDATVRVVVGTSQATAIVHLKSTPIGIQDGISMQPLNGTGNPIYRQVTLDPAAIPGPLAPGFKMSYKSSPAGSYTPLYYTHHLMVQTNSATPANACYSEYIPYAVTQRGVIFLWDDAAGTLTQSTTLGSFGTNLPLWFLGGSGVVENSQCKLDFSNAWMDWNSSYSVLTWVVPVTFKSSFNGAKQVFYHLDRSDGTSFPWVPLTNWTVQVP